MEIFPRGGGISRRGNIRFVVFTTKPNTRKITPGAYSLTLIHSIDRFYDAGPSRVICDRVPRDTAHG